QEQLAKQRVFLRAVGQLAGQRRGIEGALAASQVARLSSGLAGPGSLDRFGYDLAANRRVLLEITAQLLIEECFDLALYICIELALSLAFELRLGQLDADHRYQALPDVFGGELFVVFLEQAGRFAIVVDGASQSRPEAGQMGAAVYGVDVVGERVDDLVISIVVLNGDLDPQRVFVGDQLFGVDRVSVQHGLVLVQVFDEFGDAALVEELVAFFGPLIGNTDADAGIQECLFPQPLREGVKIEFGDLEYLWIRLERDPGAALFGLSRWPQRRVR